MALRLYFDALTQFTGRSGTELLSATFGGRRPITVNGRPWLEVAVDGKTGRALRYCRSRVTKLLTILRALRLRQVASVTGATRLFPNGCGYGKQFRDAMRALEGQRGEAGHWTARFRGAKGISATRCPFYLIRKAD